jgi:glucokinase
MAAPVLLADIGGTHIRFGLLEDGQIRATEKRPVAEFTSFVNALDFFRDHADLPGRGALAVATAAWPDESGAWVFAHEGRWPVIPSALAEKGWDLAYIGNDFSVSARGAVTLSPSRLKPLRDGEGANSRAVVMGPGTGLGIAYVDKGTGEVSETFGGHMICPVLTEEQAMIARLVTRLKTSSHSLIAEDIVSGPGLEKLYRAVSLLYGRALAAEEDPSTILRFHHEASFQTALRLFHEFLGQTVHQACLFGHAFGGVYLDGGLIHKLLEHNLFDHKSFSAALIQNPVPVVKKPLETMPVFAVRDPYVALKGLQSVLEKKALEEAQKA